MLDKMSAEFAAFGIVSLAIFSVVWIIKRNKSKKEARDSSELTKLDAALQLVESKDIQTKVSGLKKLSDLLDAVDEESPIARSHGFGAFEEKIDNATNELDLEYADFENVHLTDLYITSANLSHSNMNGVRLIKCNLNASDLSGANLADAKLTFSNLSGTDLKDATLHNTYLFGVNLQNANLINADLSNANLQHANLSDADIDISMVDALHGTRYGYDESKWCNTDFTDALYDEDTIFPKDFDPVAAGMVEVDKYSHEPIISNK